ncbi:MAG: hypothetical protein JSV62_15620 [Promethearchaeota archaeon]|nr:MAG: hypothetical protein JSV62_15620 [Candidatus Lokiarchaeota archaeon]
MSKKNQIYLFSFIIMSISIVIFSFSSNLYLFQEIDLKNNTHFLNVSDHDDIFGEIHILRPSKSEFLRVGQNFTIKWDSKGSIEFVTIALYKDYQHIETITITTSNNGEYVWFIGNHEDADDYSIGIWDYMDFNNNDFSDSFTISMNLQKKFDNFFIMILIVGLIALTTLFISFTLIKLKKKR